MHCNRTLIVQTLVFSRSYLHSQESPPETLVVKRGTKWARNGRWILPENARLPRNIQGSFTCRKSTTWDKRLCTDNVFLPVKIRRLRSGLNPRTWVPKASTLPLDHRSRLVNVVKQTTTSCIKITPFIAGILSWEVSKPVNWSVVTCLIQFHIDYILHPYSALGTRLQTVPVLQGLQLLSVGSGFCSIGFPFGHVLSFYVPVETKAVRRMRADSPTTY